jgi:hypothetical protein
MNVADALFTSIAVVCFAVFTASDAVAAEVHSHLTCLIPWVRNPIVDYQFVFIFICEFAVRFFISPPGKTWARDSCRVGSSFIEFFAMKAHPAEATASETHEVSAMTAHKMTNSTKADLTEVVAEGLSEKNVFISHYSVVFLYSLVLLQNR